MESEARQNPLSKNETIEQLRTTIDKLETIIEQLDSTSVVNLPSPNAVEALITTTEELENTILNIPTETVAIDSEPTPINEVEPEQPEATTIPLEEEQPVVEPENTASQIPIPQPSVETASEPTEPKAPNNITQPKTKPPTKSRKSKKKKNWIAIAIVALIVAIIPISLKYLSPGVTQQLFSEKTEEIIKRNIIEETPVIAKNLPDNNVPKNNEQTATSELEEQLPDLTSSEIPQQQEQKEEIIEVATTDLITEESPDFDFPESKFLAQEEIESTVTKQFERDIPLINNEPETIIALDNSKLPEIAELETSSVAESPSNIDEIAGKKNTLEIDDISEKSLKQKQIIVVPETLVAEFTTEPLELKTVINNVKLTPEQNLIALLRDKVLQLSENYQEDLVLSIEPNVASNIMIVKISDDWYQLESTEQDAIVANILSRSQELEFRKLEIKDQNDYLVARSPVVGQKMIIFRRDF